MPVSKNRSRMSLSRHGVLLRKYSERPERIASEPLVWPQRSEPMTPVMPSPKLSSVLSTKDLNPWSSSLWRNIPVHLSDGADPDDRVAEDGQEACPSASATSSSSSSGT